MYNLGILVRRVARNLRWEAVSGDWLRSSQLEAIGVWGAERLVAEKFLYFLQSGLNFRPALKKSML